MEIKAGVFPNLGCTIAEKDNDFGQCETATNGSGAKEFAAFEAVSRGAIITGRVGITLGVAVVIDGGLGEDATEFGFAGFGGSVGLFAEASGELFGSARYAGAMVIDIENRDGLERRVRSAGVRP